VASRVVAAIRRSAVLAAALSFVWPGLGQGWAGAWRRALLLAAPMMLLAGIGLLVFVTQGTYRTAGLLLQPTVLLALLLVNTVVLAYRSGAIVDAFQVARRRWPAAGGVPRQGGSLFALGVLLGATVLMHSWIGLVTYKTYDTVVSVFHEPEATPTPTPEPTTNPSASPTATPQPTPEPTPEPVWSDNGRLDLLLIGGDAGPGRWSLRTDTMILLSVDVATGRAALFGIPRNMINVPLPDGPADFFECRCYPDLLNSLFTYAIAHPEYFPGVDEERGYRAVQDAIATLTGADIDGQVVVTLNGFVRLVDALGGLDINVPYAVYDARYPPPDGSSNVEIYIPAGQQHMNGWTALAYARSRHQDNDYNRMDRQQLVLRALRRQVDPCILIPRITELLDVARDSLWTNVPIAQLPDLFSLGARVDAGSIARYQFWPPTIKERLDGVSIALVQRWVATAFDNPPTPTPIPSASGTPAATPAPLC
jgi:LCP family protein required for cell wall assembly